MRRQKLEIIFYAIMVICGIYALSKINLYETIISLSKNNQKSLNNGILALHVAVPWLDRGRKLPKNHIYEPRPIGFAEDLKNMKKTSDETKVILLWTPWYGFEETINYYALQEGSDSFVKYNCPNQKCVTTRNRKHLLKADAVLFHLIDTKSSDLPISRTAKQKWILYNMEPPYVVKKMKQLFNDPELRYFNSLFNWTLSYRSDSDVVARYGYIAEDEQVTSSAWLEHKTKNIVWFVSNCKTDSRREDYVEELKKYIDVDVYGTCGNMECYPAQSSTCYEKVLKHYKFYLSFENSICKDYATEKFFNIFNYDIIPIVLGAASYSTIAPEGTFIDATQYPEPKLLASTLLNISNNKDIYSKILYHKRSFRAYLDPWMCRLCSALHTDEVKSSILNNLEEWWSQEAQCKRWDKDELQFIDTNQSTY